MEEVAALQLIDLHLRPESFYVVCEAKVGGSGPKVEERSYVT